MRRVAVALLLTLLPMPAAGQRVASCDDCVIQRTRVATLGDPADSVLLGVSSGAQRFADGRFVADSFDGTQLLEYDRAGRFVRAVGRQGRGPGEFHAILALAIGPGDTLLVGQAGRVDVYTPDLLYVRTMRAPGGGPGGLMQLASGHIVTQHAAPRVPDFLHMSDRNGEFGRSFGSAQLTAEPCSGCRTRLITAAPGAPRFFALSPSTYELELWSIGGELMREHAIASRWFHGQGASQPRNSAAPAPALNSAAVDAQGRLWVGGWMPNAEWTPPRTEGSVGGVAIVRANSRNIDRDRGYDTYLEVVDPETGRVLATNRVDGELLYILPGGHAWSRTQMAAGYVQIHVWKLELAPRPR